MTGEEMLALEGEIIQAIGRELHKLAAVRGPGVVFYAEPADTLVQSAAFAGDDRNMVLVSPSTELNLLARDLWRVRKQAAPQGLWSALTFILLGGEFRVTYIAPDQMYAGADANERCKTMIRTVMGPVRVTTA